MAVWVTMTKADLGWSVVLAPERYDPRRGVMSEGGGASDGIVLGELVEALRKTVDARRGACRCLVLDTCDANEGLVVGVKPVIDSGSLGSTKKVVEEGCVLISRLRPYLRQVAFVDAGLPGWEDGVTLVCSTEFFVLRSVDERSIAFLVPFLLCETVQKVLAAAQEGGHHPRFNESTLLSLRVPMAVIERRDTMSRMVEECAKLYREAEKQMAMMVGSASALM